MSTTNNDRRGLVSSQRLVKAWVFALLASATALVVYAQQPVNIANTPAVSQSGTWNITNISGTVSLPTGAATAAKQPALGTAGSASADVITIQGIASMTAVKVDGTGGTFPSTQSGNWSVRAQDGAGNALTSNSTTYSAKFALDANILGTKGTAFTTAGFIDIKGADGDVFVRQATASNLKVEPAGNVASAATDSGNPLKIGGKYNSSAITLTDGQRGDLQLDASGYVKVNVAAGGASGGTSSSFNSAFPSTGTAVGASDGTNMKPIKVDGSGNLLTSCSNCSGSGASAADEAAFTAGTTSFAPSGGFYQTTATSNALTNGQGGWMQLTAQRALFTNLRNASGTEIGTSGAPLQVDLANTSANATALKVNVASGGIASGAIASGAIASGAVASGAVASGAFASGALASGSISDGADVTLGAKADARSTATDTTAVTIMQVLKEISFMLQTPAALPNNQSTNIAQWGGTTVVNGGVAGIVAVGGNVANAVTATANPVPVGGVFTTSPTTLTTGQTATLQFTAAQNAKIDLTTVAGTALSTNVGAAGTGTPRVVDVASGTTGSAVPTQAGYIGAQDASANLIGDVVCTSSKIYDASTSGNTELVAISGSKHVYVCGWEVLSGGTVNVSLVAGTGTACASAASGATSTGTTGASAALTPAWQLTAQTGKVSPYPTHGWLIDAGSANALCIKTSGAVAVQAQVFYSQR